MAFDAIQTHRPFSSRTQLEVASKTAYGKAYGACLFKLLELLPYFIDFEVLFSDLPMVYIRKDHPTLRQEWNMDTFLSYAHINVTWEKNDSWALDEILTEQGHTRNVTAPKYCQKYCQQLHPYLVALPIPIAEEYQHKLLIPFTMIWHKRNNQNPKVVWLRETIKNLYGEA